MGMRPGLGPFILVLLTLAALAFGAYFYYEQLSSTPIYLWLFVPDCPLYAALASVILLFSWPKNPFIRFIIASACALYGSWTIFVFLTYPGFYFSPSQSPITLALVFGHLGMILQALLVLPREKELRAGAGGLLALALAWAWLGLNTFLDYGFGPLSTHPWLTDPLNPSIGAFTWAGSFLLPPALLMMSGWAEKNKGLEKLREMVRLT